MIPNPTKDFHDFYNQLLGELFDCSYELMSPLQFKQYVIYQRVHRWKYSQILRTFDSIAMEHIICAGKLVLAPNFYYSLATVCYILTESFNF